MALVVSWNFSVFRKEHAMSNSIVNDLLQQLQGDRLGQIAS